MDHLWNAISPSWAGQSGPMVLVHDVTNCLDCDAAAEHWKAAHAAWWSDRSGPRPTLSPFCDRPDLAPASLTTTKEK